MKMIRLVPVVVEAIYVSVSAYGYRVVVVVVVGNGGVGFILCRRFKSFKRKGEL